MEIQNNITKIQIDSAIIEKFENLSDKNISAIAWTKEMDLLLMKYWRIKSCRGVSKLLGVSERTARDRFNSLKEEEDYDGE